MANRAFFVFLALCILAFQPSSASAKSAEKTENKNYVFSPSPAWIAKQNFNAAKQSDKAQSLQYLLVDNQVDLRPERPIYFNRYVTRVLNQTGIGDGSEIRIDFNPAFHTLHLHEFIVSRGSSRSNLADKVDVRIIQREDRINEKIQDGVLTALVNLPDIRVGDIIDYSFSIEGENPIFGAKDFATFSLSWGIAVDKHHFNLLSYNPDLPFKFHQSTQEVKRSKESDFYRYSFTRNNIDAVIDEGHYPYGSSPYAWLEFSEYRSWAEVNRWAQKLYDFNSYDKSPIKQVLAQIDSQDHPGSVNDIDEIIRFIQEDIRYLGLEFGENAYLPREPAEVLQNRYGDCKEKAVLVTSLLAEKNIKAYPALVSTQSRHGIADRLPSPGVFDHVISLVEYQGKTYWVDGTRNYQRGGLENYGVSDYGFALVIKPGEDALRTMFEDGPPPTQVTISETIDSSGFDKASVFTVKTTHYGNSAEYQRFRFANNPANQIQREFLQYYAQYFPTIAPKAPVQFKDFPKENRFVVEEVYEIKNYWEREQEQVRNSVVVTGLRDYLAKPTTATRKHDYYLGEPVDVKIKLTLNYPESVLLRLDNKAVSIDHDVFSYQRKEKFDNLTYVFDAHFRRKKNKVLASNFKDYQRKVKVLDNEWQFALHTIDPSYYPSLRSVLKLKRELKALAGSL